MLLLQMFALFFYYTCGHALSDYTLQTDSMAKGKNPYRPVDPATVPPGQKPAVCWYFWLGAHALIHGLTVALVTAVFLTVLGAGDPWLAATVLSGVEVVVHFVIDLAKCAGNTTMNQDQTLHAACKLAYVLLVVLAFVP